MYVNRYPVYADEVRYGGTHDPMETVCEIRWCVADVLDMMAYKGIELTDENLERLLDAKLGRWLQDRSTELGWEVLEIIIDEETCGWMRESEG